MISTTSHAASRENLEEGNDKPAENRALALLHDSRAGLVEERRVLCARCMKWIPLEDKYCLKSWSTHIRQCRVFGQTR